MSESENPVNSDIPVMNQKDESPITTEAIAEPKEVVSPSPPSESTNDTNEAAAISETPPEAPSQRPNKNNNRGHGRRNNRSGRGRRRGSGNQTTASGRRYLTVASNSHVKMVAGSIAHTSRATDPPVLSAVGPASVNQAVKAIAVARTYLQDDKLELYVEVVRPPGNSDIKDLIRFSLYKYPAREPQENSNTQYTDLRSAGSTGTGQLAGAIAKSVRDGIRVRIKAIGADSIFRAIDAITFARTYLQPDGFDVRFQPKFIKVTFEDGSTGNAMQLELFVQQF